MSGVLYENPKLAVPLKMATVHTEGSCIATEYPAAVMLDMLVADIQTVLTDDVCPSRTASDDAHTPICPPKSTTPNLPVHGPFTLPSCVNVGASWDIARVHVPARIPIVDKIAAEPRAPKVLLHKTVVSDLHVILSHAEAPLRIVPVTATCAYPCPDMEILEAPVNG